MNTITVGIWIVMSIFALVPAGIGYQDEITLGDTLALVAIGLTWLGLAATWMRQRWWPRWRATHTLAFDWPSEWVIDHDADDIAVPIRFQRAVRLFGLGLSLAAFDSPYERDSPNQSVGQVWSDNLDGFPRAFKKGDIIVLTAHVQARAEWSGFVVVSGADNDHRLRSCYRPVRFVTSSKSALGTEDSEYQGVSA